MSGQVNPCGTDADCLNGKRSGEDLTPAYVNVSAAYFLSIEFQQTGYLIERIYKTAYGEANGASTFSGPHQLAVPIVRLSEFLTDTQRIGRGVVVLQSGWEAAIENKRKAAKQIEEGYGVRTKAADCISDRSWGSRPRLTLSCAPRTGIN